MNAKEARELMERSSERRNNPNTIINKFLYWFFMKDITRKIRSKAEEGEFILKYMMDGWSPREVISVVDGLREKGYKVRVGEILIENRNNALDTRTYPYITIGW